jgi:hypothetical protein
VKFAAGIFAVFFAAQSVALIAAEGTALAKSSRPKRSKKKAKPKPTPASSSRADGREHLKKANALAAKDACELAIEEYTLAFDRLNDPEILLPRAECRRRVGQAAEAVADYKAYLEVTPDVKNRADLESKIAALESGASPSGPPVEKPSAPPPPPPVADRKPPPVADRKPPPSPPVTPPVTAPPPPATFEPPPAPPVTVEVPVAPPEATPPPVAPAPEPTRRTATELEARPAESKGHFWLWTIVAVVVVGGAAAAGYWYLRPVDEPPPATQLGNYRF